MTKMETQHELVQLEADLPKLQQRASSKKRNRALGPILIVLGCMWLLYAAGQEFSDQARMFPWIMLCTSGLILTIRGFFGMASTKRSLADVEQRIVELKKNLISSST